MNSAWLKKEIKNFLPQFMVKAARAILIKTRKPNLFDDELFLSYVYRKQRGLEKKKDQIQTLALRGSIADYGFYPGVEGTDYNLGLTSSDLYTAYHLYLKYRSSLRKLKHVIVYINSASIGFNLINTSERYRAVAYKYFFNVPYQANGQIKKRHEKNILKRCSELSEPVIEENYLGFDKKPGIDADAKNRALTHLRENRREPDQIPWLVALHDAVIQDGRSFHVVLAPARSDYKRYLPFQEKLFKKVYDLRKRGVDILDFYNSTEITDLHMADTDHLNDTGAAILTQMIMKRIPSVR